MSTLQGSVHKGSFLLVLCYIEALVAEASLVEWRFDYGSVIMTLRSARSSLSRRAAPEPGFPLLLFPQDQDGRGDENGGVRAAKESY